MGSYVSSLTKGPSVDKMSSSPLAFKHYAQAQSTFKPPLIANDNAFLGDIFSRYSSPLSNPFHPSERFRLPTDIPLSEKVAPEAPISCGLYRLEPGVPLDYTYTYHEMKIILEGDFTISDETGQKVHAVAGDVFNFPKGSKIRFETEKGGLAFYTGQVSFRILEWGDPATLVELC
ncbi:hypothetical protein MMC11_000703 [Xylographa trunciseda]|nr:hypothetical protein [Xylographa trunciseda]